MYTTIFGKIINKEIPAKIIYEDEDYLAFQDINPQMETHVLIIPKIEITSFHTTNPNQKEMVKGLFDIAWKLIDQYQLDGCQLHINSGKSHGQEVFHIHLHLMSHTRLE